MKKFKYIFFLLRNKILINILTFFILFFITDLVYSNFIEKRDVRSNCVVNKNKFYFLEKNCFFKQNYIRNVKQYNVYTNKFGLRFSGKEINKKNKYIFYFGDSFTYGLGLDYKKTYVGMMENKLINYNHLNFGLQGYSPAVYLYQLNKMINEGIYPNKIFLALDFTDIFEESDRWVASKDKYLPPSVNDKAQRGDQNSNFKDKHFKGSKIIAQTINGFFRNLRLSFKSYFNKDKINEKTQKTEIGSFLYSSEGNYVKKKLKTKNLKDRSKKLEETLKEISELSTTINADFYIIIYPWPDTLVYGQNNFNWENFAAKFCKNNCTKLVNTFPTFLKFKKNDKFWKKKLFINQDLHHTELGHSLITNEILKNIK